MSALQDWQGTFQPEHPPTVYVSGPMTGKPDYNFNAFHVVTDGLREQGFLVVSPAELDEQEKGGVPDPPASGEDYGPEYISYLSRDVEHVVGVDGLVMLPGWQESRGARFEAMIAVGLDKPIFSSVTGERIILDFAQAVPTDENVLEEANRLVGGARGENYGHPYDDFGRTAAIISAIIGTEVTRHQVPLIMIAVKLSRHCNKPKRDNIVDIAGYARTAEMVAERAGDWK